jgi:hypothetical protein
MGMSTHTHDTPSEAAEQGQVHVDGPGAVAVSLTPNAARKAADRLAVAAVEADGQDQDEVHPDVANVEDIPPDTPSL